MGHSGSFKKSVKIILEKRDSHSLVPPHAQRIILRDLRCISEAKKKTPKQVSYEESHFPHFAANDGSLQNRGPST